jgi:hypothetical protein
MAGVKTWLRNNGLLLANVVLFVIFFGGMVISGVLVYNSNEMDHGQPPVTLAQYLSTGDFIEATFENWESEFLQMGMYVVLTAYLFQKGSSESKPVTGGAPQDEDPRIAQHRPDAPWPVRRGGWVLVLYEHSLSIMFFLLFFASVIAHGLGGAKGYSDEQVLHGGEPVSFWEYMGTSQFWFESMQNWQSEFLAIAVMVGASVYFRERGSAESKPVATPHSETGS